MSSAVISKLICSEIRATLRETHSWLTPVLFFVLVVCLFPFALGSNDTVLQTFAPGIIWVAALMAVILSMHQIFRRDREEGYLDLYLLSPYPLSWIVLCKTFSHWLTHCLPLIVISPLLGLLLHLPASQEIALVITLSLGTPALILLGSTGAALVLSVRGQSLLLPVLIMPFYIPVLIFGAGALNAAAAQLPLSGYYAILGAIVLVSLGFAPLLTAAALRLGANSA